MASGSNYLTTYYAKRIIGDSAAANRMDALLQTGENIEADTWILGRTNRVTDYGIKYIVDTTNTIVPAEEEGGTPTQVANEHDKIQFIGKGIATAWVQLDTGDFYAAGKVGIGYDPTDSENDNKLYVNGTSYLNGNITVGGHIYADTARTYNIGSTDKEFQYIYARFFDLYANSQIYGYLAISTNGTAGDGTNKGTRGDIYLRLGNNIARTSTNGEGTDNACGHIEMYGETAYRHNIYPGEPTADRNHWFPNATGWIVTGGNGISTGAGDIDTPVYLKTDGTLAAITSYDGNAATATCATRQGVSVGWHKGRDAVVAKTTTINGYSPTISVKTTNGSWEIGSYNNSSYTDKLIFSYVTDANYNSNTNSHVDFTITTGGYFSGSCASSAACTGNAATATNVAWTGITSNPGIYANDVSSYGNVKLTTAKGGYYGIHLGTSTSHMTVMSSGQHNGLYVQAKRWFTYYDSTNDRMALFNSTTTSGYGLTINTNTYASSMIQIQANSYPLLRLQRTDANEVSMYFINNTAGWAIGINTWSVGAGQFAIGQYSGTGGSYWRFRIDNNGYCYTRSYLNLGAGNEKNDSSPSYVAGFNSSDNYVRSYNTSYLNVNSANLLNINNRAPIKGNNQLEFQQFSGTGSTGWNNSNPTNDWYHHLRFNHANANGYFVDLAFCFHAENNFVRRVVAGSDTGWKRLWTQGNAVTSAVWNDYAENRTAPAARPGQVLYELGDDTLAPTSERLQHFAGIASDTWGFSQGETDTAKTPIAVAGRVLAYPYRPRDQYKPGDVLCTAPGGTVDIMTRDEVIMYPDRIVGIVSCVPDYTEWGGGDDADRPSVNVDGRIWVKVR